MVTRPAHQAGFLGEMIEARGGRVVCFPVLEITAVCDPRPTLALLDRLEAFDLAIFVSANAVTMGLPMVIERRGRWPATVQTAAIGASTAAALERHGLTATIRPARGYDSEGLLACPELQTVAGMRVVVFRGEGGRELLADTLRARGAQVDYAEVYRRVRPSGRWEQAAGPVPGLPHAIVVTSGEGLENLYQMTSDAQRPRLLATPLVVISSRIAERARAMGFHRPPVVAEQAGDGPVVAAIARWWAAEKHRSRQ